MSMIRALIAVLAFGLLLPSIVSAQSDVNPESDTSGQFDPNAQYSTGIPDEYCGRWFRHSAQIKIYCYSIYAPDTPEATIATNMDLLARAYTNCTSGTNPQPCDPVTRGGIQPGLHTAMRAARSADPSVDELIAKIVSSTDQSIVGQEVSFTIEPGPLLAVKDGSGTKYCRVDTDPAMQQLWCPG